LQQGRQSSVTILEIRLNDVKKSLFLNDLEKINAIGENVKGVLHTSVCVYIYIYIT